MSAGPYRGPADVSLRRFESRVRQAHLELRFLSAPAVVFQDFCHTCTSACFGATAAQVVDVQAVLAHVQTGVGVAAQEPQFLPAHLALKLGFLRVDSQFPQEPVQLRPAFVPHDVVGHYDRYVSPFPFS